MKPAGMSTRRLLKVFAVTAVFLLFADGQARQFRSIAPISTPQQAGTRMPDGAVPVQQVRQVDRGTVETAMRRVTEAWNTPQMAQVLAEEFYDDSRLLDNMDYLVPRNATVRLQSVQGVQTLQQYLLPAGDGGRDKRVSIVSATARTQVEFERPGAGFVRLPGVNEYILKITTLEPESP